MANIKKWILKHKIVFMSALMLVMVPLSAFASGTSVSDSTAKSGTNWVVLANGDLFTLNSTAVDTFFYNNSNALAVKVGSASVVEHWYHSDGSGGWVLDSSYPSSNLNANTTYNISNNGLNSAPKNANVGVYSDTSGTTFFFKIAPPPPPAPPAQMAHLQTLVDNVLQVLQTGGLLGVGLAILATMLGVSLVPRLVRLFLH